MSGADYAAIDAVVNLWTREALSVRPDWKDEFFAGKMRAKDALMAGLTLDEMIERMQRANIGHGFLVAAKAGRVGLPGCYHMPPQVVADAVRAAPARFSGLLGIDPHTGMDGVRELEHAVKDLGFIGAHSYPHWYDLPPDHARYYPFYAKCVELGVPVQIQVGQSMIYSKDHRTRSTGRPIALDAIACDFPELFIVGIHVGIPWVDEMIAMAWKHENVFIGCDAHSPKYWPDSFVKYMNSYGQDKVLFGTDFPVLDFERTVGEIDALDLKPTARRKIMRDNVIRVYGLDPDTGSAA
ncbi:MAG: amidohydrolase family protein [Pseudomonadota bacterium]